MKIIKYPGGVSKKEILEVYAARLLECIKTGMRSSYDIVLEPEGDSSWYKYLNINLDKGVRYVILEDGERIRGYLVWNAEDDEVHIYDLVIHPDFHSDCATLRHLLKAFAADLYGTEMTVLVAYTNYKNERMNRLLLRHGFEIREKKTRGTVYAAGLQKLVNKFK